eukprot:103640_1
MAEAKEDTPPPRKMRAWDEERRIKYQDEMEDIMTEMIGEHRLKSDEIEKFVDEIVDIANTKLKKNRVKRYLYWTTVFVCRSLDKKKSQRGMNWENKYDHAICVQVRNTKIHVMLTSFLCSLNTWD